MSHVRKFGLTAVVALGLIASPTRASQGVCLPETAARVALNRGFIDWPASDKSQGFQTNILGLVAWSEGTSFIKTVLVSLIKVRCEVAFSHVYNGDSARLIPDRLMGQDLADVVTETHGGSGNGFNHHLLLNSSSGIAPLSTPDFSHTNMGGFYVGDLGKNRGSGAVLWEAIWENGSHYTPHRYRFSFFRWNGSSFDAPERIETKEAFAPAPDIAAQGAGFSFRDETGQDQMPMAFLAP